MMAFEDVHFQLIDLPAISREHPVPWLGASLQTADAAFLVLDLGDPACLDEAQDVLALLAARGITLTEHWHGSPANGAPGDDDPFARRIPALMLANKSDLAADERAELDAFRELGGFRFPARVVSSQTGEGLAELGPWLFANMGVVRIYTKAPGHAPDKSKPYTLRPGGTVSDLARHIHNDLAQTLRYARVWGRSGFDGQHVGPEHVLSDGDVVELHT
jgi:ribosome-interacting GTPase 1